MTEDEKIMIEALTRICKLAKSWEGRREAPYWNLGDIAAAALIKVAQHGVQPTYGTLPAPEVYTTPEDFSAPVVRLDPPISR